MLFLQSHSFSIRHIPASQNKMSDILSRHPVELSPADQRSTDTSLSVCIVLKDIPITLDSLISETQEDEILQEVKQVLFKNDWDKNSKHLHQFYVLRSSLCVSDEGLLMFEDRVVVPESLKEKILAQAHEGHAGSTKMKEILRSYFRSYWPKMTKDIDEKVRKCKQCVKFSNTNYPAPMFSVAESVNNVWNLVAIDFVGPSSRLNNKDYLSVIDCYSRFPFLIEVNSTSSSETVNALRTLFCL